MFRIARRVAADRVISTVDPECRHGHKTSANGFDGYKGHAGVDPDSEIITDTTVTAGNVGDAAVAAELIDDLTGADDEAGADERTEGSNDAAQGTDAAQACETTGSGTDAAPAPEGAVQRRPGGGGGGRRRLAKRARNVAAISRARRAEAREARRRARAARRGSLAARHAEQTPKVYGDAAYGSGEFLDHLARAGIDNRCKTQPPVNVGGRFAKDRFDIDLDAGTVTCPAGATAPIRRDRGGAGVARFGSACEHCPLRADCTTAPGGRSITVGRYEARLADARAQAADPEWVEDYRSTRPKVERKLGHMMRRHHGGRRARVRGKTKVDADFNLLAAGVNLARLAVLELASTPTGWTAAMP